MLKNLRKKKTVQESDRFFSMFAGEFVKATLKTTTTDMIHTPEGTISQQTPLSVTGYLLDMDELYYYLGEEPGEVHAAIKIKDVTMIQEVKMERVPDAMDLLLDTADMKKMN